jgi:hypothetical protein
VMEKQGLSSDGIPVPSAAAPAGPDKPASSKQ